MSLVLPLARPARRLPQDLPIIAAAVVVSVLSSSRSASSSGSRSASGWDTVVELVFGPRLGELLLNTFVLEVVTLPIAIVLALALAWLTERTDLPRRALWSWLAVAPLAMPAFVHSYAWNSVAPTMHGLPGAVLVSVLAYFPFLYLPIAAQLRRLDPALEDIAASLGAAAGRRFSCAWCCRNCGWPSAAGRCWSGCICWPNTGFTC